MKKSIKTLFEYIMSANIHHRQGWHKDYNQIIDEVDKLRNNLKENSKTLNDPDVYEGTFFQNKEGLFDRLFSNTGNGIASNGQSIFSGDNRSTVINDYEFLFALKNLITEPSEVNHNLFAKVWHKKLGKNNPVQTNRATAACSKMLTTTVDNGKFNQVWSWLIKHGYMQEPEEEVNGWYARNIYLVKWLRNEFSNELGKGETDELWLNVFTWLIFENLANPFSLKKQVVKFGAPGTGKTYQARKIAEMQFALWKNTFGINNDLTFEETTDFIQFHPSFTYEDFIEGLRPVINDEGQSHLQLRNGIFKQLCIRAAEWESDIHRWGIKKDWDKIIVNDLKSITDKGSHWSIIDQAEDYDFIQDVIPPFFILIDEINRAELSRVFGELMYCLEYRGVSNSIKTQYAELNNPETGMLRIDEDYRFYIPNNLFIIASMNTIDRSVESFDFALRRRFRWEEMEPDIDLLRYHLGQEYPKEWSKLADNLENLNNAIENESLLGKDYRVGHGYFWSLNYSKKSSASEVRKLIWEDSLGSLITEYLRGTGKEGLINHFAKSFGI